MKILTNFFSLDNQKLLILVTLLFAATSLFGNIEIVTQINPSNGECNGKILVTTSGTAGPFSLTLSIIEQDGSMTVVEEVDVSNGSYWFKDLCAGDYNITVTNDYDCEVILSTSLDCNVMISIDPPSIDHPSGCNNDNGDIHFFSGPSGGTTPYSYLWDMGATSLSINELASGTYILTITDAVGCTLVESYELIAYGNPEIFSQTSETCEGVNNGGINIVVLSENLDGEYNDDFSYQWSNGSNSNGGVYNELSNLYSGLYCVTVTDNLTSCTVTECFQVPSIPSNGPINVDASVTPSCENGESGKIELEITGGTEPFTYEWEGPGPSYNMIGATAGRLQTGTYCVTITDLCNESFSNCYDVDEFEISITGDIGKTCEDYSLGSINMSFDPGPIGNSGWNYSWSNGATTQDISELDEGWYSVTISHPIYGCDKIELFFVGTDETYELQFQWYGYFWHRPSGHLGWFFEPKVCIYWVMCNGVQVDWRFENVEVISVDMQDGTCVAIAKCGDEEFSPNGDGFGTVIEGQITADENGCYQTDICEFIDFTSGGIDPYTGIEYPFIYYDNLSQESLGNVTIEYECFPNHPNKICAKRYFCEGELEPIQTIYLTPFHPEYFQNENCGTIEYECYGGQCLKKTFCGNTPIEIEPVSLSKCCEYNQTCCFPFNDDDPSSIASNEEEILNEELPDELFINGKYLSKFRPLGNTTPSMYKTLDLNRTNKERQLINAEKEKAFEVGKIYPNPFTSTLNVELSLTSQQNIRFNIYNVIGQKVFSEKRFLENGSHTITIKPENNLENGIYFIEIANENGIIVLEKVVYNGVDFQHGK